MTVGTAGKANPKTVGMILRNGSQCAGNREAFGRSNHFPTLWLVFLSQLNKKIIPDWKKKVNRKIGFMLLKTNNLREIFKNVEIV
jgi:hypothetical protein